MISATMISAKPPTEHQQTCNGCEGSKGAPMAVAIRFTPPEEMRHVTIVLCEECGRDAANAIGFFCIRDGGWSKLEPRKRKARP